MIRFATRRPVPLVPLLLFSLSPLAAADAVVAKVGEREVRASELRGWFAGLDPARAETVRSEPAVLAEAVRTILLQEVLAAEAEAAGWDALPENAAHLERQRVKLVAEGYLRELARPEEGWPSEADLLLAYQEAGEALMAPRRFHLAQIFLAAPEGSDAKDAELAEVVRKLAARGADFAGIARAHSEEPASAGRGGDLGWLPEDLIQPDILRAVADLEPGAVSEAVRMPGGWHLVKVLAREEARKLAFDEVREALAERLREGHTREATQAALARLMAEHPVVINEIELPALLDGGATETEASR